MTTSAIFAGLALLSIVGACGDDAKTAADVAETAIGDGSDTVADSAPPEVAETVADGVPDSSPDTTADSAEDAPDVADAVADSAPDVADTVADSAPDVADTVVDSAPDTHADSDDADTAVVCRGRGEAEVEGLYRDEVLVSACAPDERCNQAHTQCVAARCFEASAELPEGVFELVVAARGASLEVCEPGYGCAADGTPYCERDPALIGTPCGDNLACGGDPATALCVLDDDAYWVGGYCAILGCKVDGDCPGASHCGFYGSAPDAGVCIADCGADGACQRAEHACWDNDLDGRRECMPQGTGLRDIGAPCAGIADCAGGAGVQCAPATALGVEGGYCTATCRADADCPGDAICQTRGTTGIGNCFTPCVDANDCLPTQACYDRDFDGRAECARPGTGLVPQNGWCASLAECGTGPLGLCLGGANFSGFCTAVCRSDDECGADSHCATADGGGVGYCMQDCSAETFCPHGPAACVDFDGDGRSECGPAPGGVVTIGRHCGVASDCKPIEGVFCGYPDLVCTRFCESDADCGVGAQCADMGAGPGDTCRATCTQDAECDVGLRCIDVDADGDRECMSTGIGQGALGSACGQTASCARGKNLLCRFDVPGGLCTTACGDGVGCPAAGHCGALTSGGHGQPFGPSAGGPDACLLDCDGDDDCRTSEGWACFDGDGDGERECLPFGGGAGGIGEACATVIDCAGGEDARCLEGPASFGGACSLACEDAAGCGGAASCVALPEAAELVCVPSCATADTCRADYACSDIDSVSGGECVYGCTSDADCAHFRGVTGCNAVGLCE